MVWTALKEVYHLIKFAQAIKAKNLGKASAHHAEYKEASKLGEADVDKIFTDAKAEVEKQKAFADSMLRSIDGE